MYSAALITDSHGSLDWVMLGCSRFVTAEQVWDEPATDGAVLRWVDDRAVELIVDAYCSRCPRGTDGYLVGTGLDEDRLATRLCSGCALAVAPGEMLRWVSLERAATEFGVPVRLADADVSDRVRREREFRSVLNGVEATLVSAELRDRVGDPVWRAQVARLADGNPQAVSGIADAVAALSDIEVLDLYPALAALGQMLPHGAIRWLERSGSVAAARLGLPCLHAGA